MVSLEGSHSHSHSHIHHNHSSSIRFPLTPTPTPPPPPPPRATPYDRSSPNVPLRTGRSMRTLRSSLHIQNENAVSSSSLVSTKSKDVVTLTDSDIDMSLDELASRPNHPNNNDKMISNFGNSKLEAAYGELQRVADVACASWKINKGGKISSVSEHETRELQRHSFSTEIIDSIAPEDLQPTVTLCVDALKSSSVAIRRSAAAKLRLLAKNRADNRVLIGESGAIPALVPLLKSSDPWTQEHAVTALLNLSLHEGNKSVITSAGAIKSLVYVLETGSETSKQNAAYALLSLALLDENKSSIGACGAIPPLVSLLINGSCRGKKDALTTLYKLCSVKQNKARAVSAGAVKPLVEMVLEREGMEEKAMAVLSSLAAIGEGREAIVEERGIAALVEAIEDGSNKGREFAVLNLLLLCADSIRNRGLLVREGGIPPLVALSQTGNARAKHKVSCQPGIRFKSPENESLRSAERLLVYLRQSRQEMGGASSSSP